MVKEITPFAQVKAKMQAPNPPKEIRFTNRLLNCILILLPTQLAKSPDITPAESNVPPTTKLYPCKLR